MKRFHFVAVGLMVLAAISLASALDQSAAKAPPFPGTLASARYVYVASYDGDGSNPNVLPEDRAAIGAVASSIQKWGKLMVVTRPSDADIIILVMSRPSEDVLAVYDAHQWGWGNYLWRVTAPEGLQPGETPLVTQFQNAFDNAQKRD